MNQNDLRPLYCDMLRAVIRSDDETEQAKELARCKLLLDEIEQIVRLECAHADVEFPENLHLGDVIEKHLCRALWARIPDDESGDGELRGGKGA
jgi:hypothetical protein